MKKSLIALVFGGALGVVGGAGGMLVAYPFLFPPPVLEEPAPRAAASPMHLAAAGAPAHRITAGTFDPTAPGRDPIHWADGTVGVYRAGDRLVLRLESDFRAGPGPRFVIYLNTTPVGDEADFGRDRGRIAIAPLRAFRGAQNYTLPDGLDLGRFRTVTIWCETFGVYIGSAALPPAQA